MYGSIEWNTANRVTSQEKETVTYGMAWQCTYPTVRQKVKAGTSRYTLNFSNFTSLYHQK
jgi:hypothetical protein